MKALSELEADALTEIFNIGVGVAADVLSQIINENVRLAVPLVELTTQEQACSQFHDRENRPLCAISQTYSGEVTTHAILMFPEENSLELVRSMVGSEVPLEQLTEMEQDAMAEIGNIILNAIISQLSNTLNLSFEGSLPKVSMVTGETIFAGFGEDVIAGEVGHSVLMLTIDFELSSRQISGYLAFLLDIPSSEKLISHLDHFING